MHLARGGALAADAFIEQDHPGTGSEKNGRSLPRGTARFDASEGPPPPRQPVHGSGSTARHNRRTGLPQGHPQESAPIPV
jgi:hypothetical protein